jgi:hypothetical protein
LQRTNKAAAAFWFEPPPPPFLGLGQAGGSAALHAKAGISSDREAGVSEMLVLRRRILCAAAAALFAVGGPGAGLASAAEFKSGYTVSYYGIPLARSEFTSSFKGDRFTVRGRMSSSGIARIFDSTSGAIKVSGRIREGRAVPETYSLSYEADGKKKRTTVRFKGGDVTDTETVPAPRKRRNWVAVKPADLKGAADPLSATIVSARSLDGVCDRTIRLYDGEMRADLQLSRESLTEWNGREAVVCKARFVPVSGYKKDKKAIAYLRDKSSIAVTFAALGETGLYAPVHASIGTEIGTITVSADAPEATN